MEKAISKYTELWLVLQGFRKNRPHVVIVDKTAILISGEKTGLYSAVIKNPVIQTSDRGEILEAFSRLEVMINEIIILKIKPSESETENFIELLDHIDSFVKLKILEGWEIIDGKLANQIHSLKKVRNEYAHHWSSYIKYKDKDIYHKKTDGFVLFSNDFQKAWEAIRKILAELQPDIMDRLKKGVL